MIDVLAAPVSRVELEAELRECERLVAAARARQIRVLRRHVDGFGSFPRPADLAGVLDVSYRTARDLTEAAKRTPEGSETMGRLESGHWSFDRAAAVARLLGTDPDAETLREADRRDIAGIDRLRSLQRRITRRSEHEAHAQRSVKSWVSLDQSMGFLSVELAGRDWRTVTAALDRRADYLPRHDASTAAQRRADALVALSQDWLDGRETPGDVRSSGPVATVMIDASLAGNTGAEAGVAITNGPRVGVETLDAIMCEGSVEVIVETDTGLPLSVGPTTRVIPPKMRRFVLNRDDGCTISGCNSNYRLEVHHIIPRSEGGTHHPHNLTTLCWWHHHVAIHGEGWRIDTHSPPKRRRLLPPDTRAPPD